MFDGLEMKPVFAERRHDPSRPVALAARGVSFWYGAKQVLREVSLEVREGEITALVGPSGCGKTTLLKCFNRMHEGARGARMEGRIELQGEDVSDPGLDPVLLRRRFGWVAQRPNPFPVSVRENVVYGARLAGLVFGRRAEADLAERHLRAVGLWDEVKDRLGDSGARLSGGQQQRLCIARALALEPEVLLMDEPCGSIDPIASARVEEIIRGFGERRTVVIITHNMAQAARLAQQVALFHAGRIVEARDAADFFRDPRAPEAKAWLAGRFG